MNTWESGELMNELIESYYSQGRCIDSENFVRELLITDVAVIRDFVIDIPQQEISTYNIPQYSSYEDGTSGMISFLRMSGNYGPTYSEVGRHFLDPGHKDAAYVKYGENHSKLAESLGLVRIEKDKKRRVYLSDIGRNVEGLDIKDQNDCFTKLSMRIPIIQYAIKKNVVDYKAMELLLREYLSASTAIRRRKNTMDFLLMIEGKE